MLHHWRGSIVRRGVAILCADGLFYRTDMDMGSGLRHGWGMRPVIGILMDWVEKGSFSARPHYAIRESYFKAVWGAGGVPVGLSLLTDTTWDYLRLVQGIVIPGGDYPSPSRWYNDGQDIPDEHPRSIYNEQLVRILLQENKPLLAICAGYQELCAATGGMLWWRVKDSVPGAMNHRADSPDVTAHDVRVAPGSLLHALVKTDVIQVNSHHHEAVRSVGEGVAVCGTAPDGVIEAIEVPGKAFALGVQWHPEFLLSESDRMIFQGLVSAARGGHEAE